MKTVRLRLRELLEEKARREGVDHITQEQIEDATGIPQGTISRWIGNKIERYDRKTMEKLIMYIPCEPGDLFHVEETS